MLMLSATEVAGLYSMADAFACVTEAAIAHTRGETTVPPRGALSLPRSDAELLVMPGVIDQETFGLKTWFAFGGPVDALPASSALILLIDAVLGEVVMDGGVITDLRTGAMTGLAASRLAPHDVRTVGIVGTGIQARTQALALVHAIDSLETIRVTSRNRERRLEFAESLRAELAAAYPTRTVEVHPVGSAEEACAGAGIVVAATTSTTPVVEAGWLLPDALVCGVGSHAPGHAEIDPEIVAVARRIVVDTRAGAIDGAGDIQAAIAAGRVQRDEVVELGGLLSESEESPQERKGVTVFKSVGFSAADIFSARLVARRAAADGRGSAFDLHS